MSTYLTRLAARASGRPAGAMLSPRPAPTIAAPDIVAADANETTEKADATPIAVPWSPDIEATVGRSQPDAPLPAVASPAPVHPDPAGRVAPPPPEEVTEAPQVRSAGETDPILDKRAAAPAQDRPSPAPTQQPSSSPRTSGDAGDPPPIPAMVELRPRPTAAALTARAGAKAQSPSGVQRVEVRIGRVEVRPPRPAPPPPVSPRHLPPPKADPFARLAAARRYVDRVWS